MKHWWLRLASYATTRPRRLAAIVALTLLVVALEALLPWPLKLILDHVLTDAPLPGAAAWLAALPAGTSATGLLAWLALAVLLVYAAAQGVQLAKSVLQADFSSRLQYRLAADAFERLQALSLVFHAKERKGDLVHRVALDTGCVPALLNGVVFALLTALAMLGVLFVIMWQLDPLLALVAIGVAVPMGLLMRSLGRRMTERAYRQQQLEGEVWSVAEQALTALPVVQAFAREEHEGLRFKRASHRTVEAYSRLITSQVQFSVGVNGCIALGMAAVMVLGGWQVLRGNASLGTLVVFLSYLTALYTPLVNLAYLSSAFAGAAASARRVFEVLDAREMVEESPQARPLPEPARGHVRLEGVVFGYEAGRAVLKDVFLEAMPGETVALVGPTGAGKSTLASLIPRLFDPWEGRVLLDGCDVRAATLSSVRARIALVLQDAFLLPVSISENIAYGSPGASREAIVAAAKAANADEFIRRLPNAYDEVPGEGGVTLSGGERQRIAIARALLKDAPVLILDEPASALDAKTEALVMEAIHRLTRGRTTLIIAHRLSTVRAADRIVVLERGRTVESGNDAQLLARSALYKRLRMAGFN